MEFPGVKALDDVSIDVERNEILALCGENGAGKSTLIKILTGVYRQTSGSFSFNGNEQNFKNPLEAQQSGLSVVHQEMGLVDSLSVMENIFLGRPHMRGGLVDWRKMKRETLALLNRLGVDLEPSRPVGSLSIAQQQVVEICKALAYDSQLIIMDEPSAVLTERETELLYGIVNNLKAQGATIIYISHRLEEVFKIADRVAVLRDGKLITVNRTEELNRNLLIKYMVGRELGQEYPDPIGNKMDVVFEVRNLNSPGVLHDINFELKRGEILGLGGLVGAGRTEVARALFGVDKAAKGEILINGKLAQIRKPIDAIKLGLGMISENRKIEGLVLAMPVDQNISLANYESVSNKGFLNEKKEGRLARKFIKMLDIRTPSEDQIVENLSGGNQQKVIIAKWLNTDAEILIFDEPTRGIDVGAKQEIYLLMNELIRQGKSIIMISSEMPELLGMCDRILVMSDGRIRGELSREKATQEAILELAV